MRVYPFDRVPDGSRVLAENLFTNPRLVGNGTWAEVRRNLLKTPLVSLATTGWSAAGGFGAATTDGRIVLVTATGWQITRPTADIPITAGEVASARIELTNTGSSDFSARIRLNQTGGTDAAGTPVVVPAGQRAAVALTGVTVSAGTTALRLVIDFVSAPANGEVILHDGGMIVKGTAVSPPFDGSTPDFSVDPDMRQRWLGAANASESVLEVERVAGVTAANCIAGVSTRDGKPAVRLIPTGASVYTAASFAIPVAARSAGTLIGTVHQDAPVSPPLADPNDRVANLLVVSPEQRSVGYINEAGSRERRVSFSGLAATYSAFIYHGGSLGSGDVWWTDIGLFAGSYDGPAFAGGDPDDGDIFYEWTGTPDNSTSTMNERLYLPYDADMTPHTIIEVDDLDPGVAEITVWRDDGVRWSEVRGALRVPVAGAWSGVDWECGFNRATAYRVEQFDSGGLSLGFLPASSVTLSVDSSWVHNVLDPKAGVPVGLTDKALTAIDRPYDAEVVYARGATYGTVVGSTRRGIVGANLELWTGTLEHADRVQGLLGSPGNELPTVLCVRKGLDEGVARIPPTMFIHTPSIVEVGVDVRFGGDTVLHEITATEVKPPAKSLSTPLLTLADLDAFYATLGDIDSDNLTLGDIDRRWDLAGYATV